MEEYQSDYPLTYISLFSGIGGFEVGIMKIFPNAKCLGYSEIDTNAIQVYESHFPNHKNLGDITQIDARKFKGKVDLLVGGSPCQDFSALGNGRGLRGKKSSLFHHYLRILEEIEPKHYILENVVMKAAHKEALSRMLNEVREPLGEDPVEPVMINSNVVSYQRRKRLYWSDLDLREIADLPMMEGTVSEIMMTDEEIGDYPLLYKDLRQDKLAIGQVLRDKISGRKNPRSRYYSVVCGSNACSPTLITEPGHQFIQLKKNNVRAWHPVEMERLQTFPDGWTDELSKTKRYFALGNAVTCDVISLISSMIV